MNGAPMKVLVVEDEAAAARVLVEEVAGAPGSRSSGHTRSGAEALRRIVSDEGIDLVLLDIQLPDISGMDVLRRLRAAGCDVDVMAVTVLRDPSTLQAAMALGVVHYLLKPFTAATVRQKLEHYRTFRARPARRRRPRRRPAGDRRGLHRAAGDGRRPSPERHQPGVAARRGSKLRQSGAMSAAQVAEILGTSRVTARRYLEHLTESGLAKRGSRYGRTGRPEVEYRWSGDDV